MKHLQDDERALFEALESFCKRGGTVTVDVVQKVFSVVPCILRRLDDAREALDLERRTPRYGETEHARICGILGLPRMPANPLTDEGASDAVEALKERAEKAEAGLRAATALNASAARVNATLSARAEKAEAELCAWRAGNPSDDLWRVRAEQAEARAEKAESELAACATAVNAPPFGPGESLSGFLEHWATTLRNQLATATRSRNEARATRDRLGEDLTALIVARKQADEALATARASCAALRAAMERVRSEVKPLRESPHAEPWAPDDVIDAVNTALAAPDPGADVLAVLRQARRALVCILKEIDPSGQSDAVEIQAGGDQHELSPYRAAIAAIDRVLPGGGK